MADSAVLSLFLKVLELLKDTNKILSVEVGNHVFPAKWIAHRKTNEQLQLWLQQIITHDRVNFGAFHETT
jgi:hypothetical protein